MFKSLMIINGPKSFTFM